MNRQDIILLIALAIGVKFIYAAFYNLIEQDTDQVTYVGYAKKSDAFWYESITFNGYPEAHTKREIGFSDGPDYHQSEWAFFPFYPLLNAASIKFFALTYNQSALLWSIVFSILTIVGIYWFGVLFYKDEDTALFNALVLFFFPFSFYFSMFYTEAIYFTLVIFSFISIYYKKYWALAILLIPLALIRPNGIVVMLPLYLYHLERTNILSHWSIDWKKARSTSNVIRSIAFISGPFVFILYCFYQYQKTGFFFAFSIAQNGWYRELTFPVLSFFRSGDIATQFNSVFTIVVIVYAFVIRKKLPLSLNTFIFLSLLLPLCSGSVTSMTRFVSVIFPLFLILSQTTFKFKYRYAILAAIFILHMISYYPWLINHPISF